MTKKIDHMILCLCAADADRGEVHVFCERFKDGQPSHCNCTINKAEVESEKCDLSHPVQAVTIDRTRDGVSTKLCEFSNYTTGTVDTSHPDATCSLDESPRVEEYILKFETIANRSRDEGAHINCNVSCLDANFEQGLTISYEGVPIQFGKLQDRRNSVKICPKHYEFR
ncbi:hypothetical protein BaRGS_00028532 [Batillaria attramentaria]|uniref:Uncharacterized protein n=1 Tax=Batillaria attramentaria TaxID=370345 RepID=A0ABD0K005_9CAEN